MSLAINPGVDKSTCHGYQDCNVVTSARDCEDDTQRQSAQDRSVNHRYINLYCAKRLKPLVPPHVCAKHGDLRTRIYLMLQCFYLTKRIFQIICPQQSVK